METVTIKMSENDYAFIKDAIEKINSKRNEGNVDTTYFQNAGLSLFYRLQKYF